MGRRPNDDRIASRTRGADAAQAPVPSGSRRAAQCLCAVLQLVHSRRHSTLARRTAHTQGVEFGKAPHSSFAIGTGRLAAFASANARDLRAVRSASAQRVSGSGLGCAGARGSRRP